MTRYWCYFKMKNQNLTTYSDGSLDDLKNGFWVNKSFQFTKKSDVHYWIPPSAIHFIEKEQNEN